MLSVSAVSQIANQLLLPPGLFVLLTAAALVLLMISSESRRNGSATGAGNRSAALLPNAVKLILTAAALALYLFSLDPAADLLLAPLEHAHPGQPPSSYAAYEKAEAVVVLGGGTVHPSPDEAPGAALSSTSLKRLLFAYRIHRHTGLPVIPSGGSPEGRAELPAEAEIAAAVLRDIGMVPELIQPEPASRSTYENAHNVAETHPYRRIILVTSAYHMPRSVRTFRSAGFRVIPAPTDYEGEGGRITGWELLPSMGALHDSYRAFHEYLGTVWYALAY